MKSSQSSDYTQTNEQRRLNEAREGHIPWKKWGPYLSERQWGTVREDYSQDGNAWNYFTHDHARSRAYHWGGKMALPVLVMITSSSASVWPSGMAKTQSSKNGCLV